MARLSLLRHAQAEPHAPTGADIDRALSLHGRTQAKGLAALLCAHDAVPDLVLCSSANRAVETWKLIETGLDEQDVDTSGIEVRRLPEIYGAGAGELLDLVRALPGQTASVLVVGHEPVISHVARILAGPDSQKAATARVRTGMSTAMLAELRVDCPWAELGRGTATLTDLAEPQPGT
ncbi:SixA phosphatase family protein [Pseudactinotalea sp. Z1739]|uniref:SixA phosphatase family protein n=1 Tax=Pseudactinotalea sp. Z1739 TaxID=3413028 RepID=UPI003C7E01AA